MKATAPRVILSFAFLTTVGLGCTATHGLVTSVFQPPEFREAEHQDNLPNTGRVTIMSSDDTELEDDAEPQINVDSFETVAFQAKHPDDPATSDIEHDSRTVTESLFALAINDQSSLDSPPSDIMTLATLEQLAFQNNPSIKQLSASVAKASGVQTQVGLKANPTIGYFGQEIGNEGSSGQQGAFVSQTFVRGDKLEWNRQVLGHDVNSLRWTVESQRQRVRTDVRVQFYAALAAQNRLRLAREFREIAEQAVDISEKRVAAKVGTRPDVLQSQIQLSEVDLAIQQAEFDLDAAWNELAAVIGLPELAPSALDGDLNIGVEERDAATVYADIVSRSPMLAAALARVDRARANMQRQRVQPIPNVTAQLGVARDNSTGDDYANIQLSLPVPYHNKNQGSVRAAYAQYAEATQNVQRLRMQIRQNLARVMRDYQVAQVTVQRYESSIMPNAEETLKLMQEAQAAGEYDFLRVLTARRTYFDVNLNYVTAQAKLAQANATIDGLLLTGSLDNVKTWNALTNLRRKALGGQ
jgi:outer membrane protein, heavy metal efflux system